MLRSVDLEPFLRHSQGAFLEVSYLHFYQRVTEESRVGGNNKFTLNDSKVSEAQLVKYLPRKY